MSSVVISIKPALSVFAEPTKKKAAYKELTIADIAKICLVNFAPDPKIPNPPLGDAAKFVDRQYALILSVSDRIKRTTAFDAIKSLFESEIENDVIFDEETCKNLDLLCGLDGDLKHGIASEINKFASTEVGKAFLLTLLARPTANIELLQKRQQIVQAMAAEQDSKLASELEKEFENLAEDEGQFLSFWESKVQLPGCVNNQYYKYFKTLDDLGNSSSTALTAHAWLDTAMKFSNVAAKVCSAVFMPAYLLGFTGLGGFALSFVGVNSALNGFIGLSPSEGVQKANAGLVGTLSGLKVRSSVVWAKADICAEAFVQHKLMHVARLYRQMKKIYNIASKYSALKHLQHLSKLEAFFKSPRLQPLFEILESSTFDSKADYLFQKGKVLAAWNLLVTAKEESPSDLQSEWNFLMKKPSEFKPITKPAKDKSKSDVKPEDSLRMLFLPALGALGEIDAYMSVAKFAKDRQACYPKFVTANAPELSMTGFTHPKVKNAVPNTIQVGKKYAVQNAVVTGPNGAGKSTVLKCTSLIVLAQTVGIATAKSMEFTPFKFIGSSMNIVDDLSKNLSGLQAQVARVKTLMDTQKLIGKKEFSWGVLDELFTQTTKAEGSALAVATVSEMAKNENAIRLIVSHDPEVAKLESSSKEFVNFRLATTAKDDPLFKLEKGTSEKHIATTVARRLGLDEEVIKKADAILIAKGLGVDEEVLKAANAFLSKQAVAKK